MTAETVASAVGHEAHPLVANSGLALERGRIKVSGDLGIENRDKLGALGDCARVPSAADGSTSPTLAQHVMQ